MKKQGSVKSIEKAFQILNCFSETDSKLDLVKLAQKTHLPKTTVYRILTTLKKARVVSQNEEDKKYSLGLRLFELGSLVFGELKLRKIALPEMEELSKRSGETVHLGVLDGEEVVSIEKIDSHFPLRSTVYIGKRTPIYCTGIGKALLAFQAPDKIDLLLRKDKIKKYTANTITNIDELKEELKKGRKEGFVVDNMECHDGIRCVAAPIRNFEGNVVASISISGPSIRVTENKLPQLASMVKKVAEAISIKMGAPQRMGRDQNLD